MNHDEGERKRREQENESEEKRATSIELNDDEILLRIPAKDYITFSYCLSCTEL